MLRTSCWMHRTTMHQTIDTAQVVACWREAAATVGRLLVLLQGHQPVANSQPPHRTRQAASPHSSIVASVISAPLHLCTSATFKLHTHHQLHLGWLVKADPSCPACPASSALPLLLLSACAALVGACVACLCLPLPWLLGSSAVVVSQHRLA